MKGGMPECCRRSSPLAPRRQAVRLGAELGALMPSHAQRPIQVWALNPAKAAGRARIQLCAPAPSVLVLRWHHRLVPTHCAQLLRCPHMVPCLGVTSRQCCAGAIYCHLYFHFHQPPWTSDCLTESSLSAS